MIYMPDARRLVLTAEADPTGGFVVTSSTHSLLWVRGDTLGDALAGVPPALVATAEEQQRIDAFWGTIDADGQTAPETIGRTWLWSGLITLLLLCVATWGLIIMAMRS